MIGNENDKVLYMNKVESQNVKDIKRSIKIKLGSGNRIIYTLTPEQNKNLNISDVTQLRNYYSNNNFLVSLEHTFIDNLIGQKLILSKIDQIDSGLISQEVYIED